MYNERGVWTRAKPVKINCNNCGKEHFVVKKNYDRKLRINKLGIFCSIKCGRAYQIKIKKAAF